MINMATLRSVFPMSWEKLTGKTEVEFRSHEVVTKQTYDFSRLPEVMGRDGPWFTMEERVIVAPWEGQIRLRIETPLDCAHTWLTLEAARGLYDRLGASIAELEKAERAAA
jgi:hypothetical protein